jgi:hypothetical protein
MTRILIVAVTIGMVFSLVCNSIAQSATTSDASQAVPIPDHGDLVVPTPQGWTRKLQGPPKAPTIKFTERSDQQFDLLITVIPLPASRKNVNSPENLKAMAQAQGSMALKTAKETELKLEQLKGKDAVGYFYTLTDSNPDPGSFEHMTQGLVGVGDLLLTFTFLHHQKELPQRQTALDLIAGISLKSTIANPASGPSTAPADTN